MKTNHIIQEFSFLSYPQKERLIAFLIDQLEVEEGQMVSIMRELEAGQISLPQCVHCLSEKTLRRAKIKGIQRYSCKSCGKYWLATHGTSLAGLQKKSLWQNYIQAFLRGQSIRKAAQEVGVCVQTSFRWRHRLLSSISCYLPQSIGGIVESADFQLPFSRKGQRKNIASHLNSERSEPGKTPESVSIILSVCRGNRESVSSVIKASSLNSDHVKKAITGKILHGSVHITKDTIPYAHCNNLEVIEHLCAKSQGKLRKREPINLNTAQQNQNTFLDFLIPFKGVATKYLQNYLNWHHYKEYTSMRIDKAKQIMIASLGCSDAKDWLENLIINDTIIIT
jgi:transposase-like protein